MPYIPLTVEVVGGTEERGPIFYEIRHLRDARTWNVERRYSTLHAMTEALRSDKAELPSVPFPPKRWQLPFFKAPCSMAMPSNELEERRSGLQAFLSALSEVTDSWSSPIVTSVLCGKETSPAVEEAVARDVGGSSELNDEAESTSKAVSSVEQTPEKTTEPAAAVVELAETTDTETTPAPATEAHDEFDTPERTATSATAEGASPPPQEDPKEAVTSPLPERLPTDEEEEAPVSWPEPFAETRVLTEPTPDSPPVAEEAAVDDSTTARTHVGDKTAAEAPLGDLLASETLDNDKSLADALKNDMLIHNVVEVAEAAEDDALAADSSVAAEPTAEASATDEDVDNTASILPDAVAGSFPNITSTSVTPFDSNDLVDAAQVSVEIEQPKLSEVMVKETATIAAQETTADAAVEPVQGDAAAAAPPARAVKVAQETSASADAGGGAVTIDSAERATSILSKTDPTKKSERALDNTAASKKVEIVAPAADAALSAPASGSENGGSDVVDQEKEEAKMDRQESAATDDDYRGRAHASAASRGSGASERALTSAMTLEENNSSGDNVSGKDYDASGKSGNEHDASSNETASAAASAGVGEVTEEGVAPTAKRISLLSRARRTLKKSVDELSSPTSPTAASAKGQRSSGGSGRLSAFKDKARSLRGRLSSGSGTPVVSSKSKGKGFFSSSSKVNAEGAGTNDNASPGAEGLERGNAPSAASASASPGSLASPTMDQAADVGVGASGLQVAIEGAPGGAGETPIVLSGSSKSDGVRNAAVATPPSPGGE